MICGNNDAYNESRKDMFHRTENILPLEKLRLDIRLFALNY